MEQKYYRPQSMVEALEILDAYENRARVLAGGTDMMVQLNKGELSVEAAVDITAISELRYIRAENGRIKIGALSTHTDLAQSPLLQEKAPLLAEAARSVGSLQIRNVGTVGGNIVNAQPAADTAIPLMALNAKVTVISKAGIRELPIAQLYHTSGGTTLDPTSELLAEISFAPPPDAGGSGAFGRVAKRKALSLPVFNTAVVIIPAPDQNSIEDARIVMGPVDRIPFRAKQAEQVLAGSNPGEAAFREAAATASAEARPRDSVFRGSTAYRKHLARVVVYRTLLKAWEGRLA